MTPRSDLDKSSETAVGDLGRVGHCAWIGREPERAASEHLAAYREGYSDALLWALEHDHHEIEAVLDDPE